MFDNDYLMKFGKHHEHKLGFKLNFVSCTPAHSILKAGLNKLAAIRYLHF